MGLGDCCGGYGRMGAEEGLISGGSWLEGDRECCLGASSEQPCWHGPGREWKGSVWHTSSHACRAPWQG